jgi:hypothetical protein
MKAQTNAPARTSTDLPSFGVKVLLMYEDLATGNKAMRVLDSLRHHCDRDVSFHSDMWKFDTLRSAAICRLAAQDAAGADVVVISAHGSEELPDELKAWFRQWTQHRAVHPTALVALLDHSAEFLRELDPARGYLEKVAHHAGLEFIPMVIEGEEIDLPIRHAFSDADEPPPVLEAFCRRIARLSSAAEPARTNQA